MIFQIAAALYTSPHPLVLMERTNAEHHAEQSVRLADTAWEKAYQQREQERKQQVAAAKGLPLVTDEQRRNADKMVRASRSFRDRPAAPLCARAKLLSKTRFAQKEATRRLLIKRLEDQHAVKWRARRGRVRESANVVPPLQRLPPTLEDLPVASPPSPQAKPRAKEPTASTGRVREFRERHGVRRRERPPPVSSTERVRKLRDQPQAKPRAKPQAKQPKAPTERVREFRERNDIRRRERPPPKTASERAKDFRARRAAAEEAAAAAAEHVGDD